jgi:hypothetical protein
VSLRVNVPCQECLLSNNNLYCYHSCKNVSTRDALFYCVWLFHTKDNCVDFGQECVYLYRSSSGDQTLICLSSKRWKKRVRSQRKGLQFLN